MAKKQLPKNNDLYEELIATHPEIERKGASTGYTSINGNMYTFLSKEGELGIRLSDKDREAFTKKFNAKPFIQYGATMHEYVLVPRKLQKDIKTLKPYLKKSYEYAKTLKPK